MRIVAALVGLILVGLGGWFVGGRLSTDALGMAVGVLFGILAGIPAALMVMASQRRSPSHQPQNAGRWHETNRLNRLPHHQPQTGRPPLAQQLPVIVVNAGSPAHNGGQGYQNHYQHGGQYHGREWHDASFDEGAFTDGENSFTNPNEIVMDGQFRIVEPPHMSAPP